ncbi:hypothetical protein WG907_04270 [Sphingobium sp. AN558]
MKRFLLLPVLLLAGCASVPAVNCTNAAKVRAAATLALQAIDRVCPGL